MAMGAAYGALWALIPALTVELFGGTHVAENYAVLTSTPAVGSVALSAGLAAWVYEAAAAAQGAGETACKGRSCYQVTLWSCAVLSGAAAAMATAVWLRNRSFYSAAY
jgi:hypothetical protein